MSKLLAMVASLLFIGMLAKQAATQKPSDTKEVSADLKVPDQYAVRILKSQRDQQTQSVLFEQLQKQAKSIQDAFNQDDKDIKNVEAEALKATGHDPAKWVINRDKLVFEPKPEPPPDKNEKKK